MSFHSRFLHLCLAGALALSALPLAAQSLPAPAEFYFDEDRATTQPVVAVRADDPALIDRLAKQVERDPRAWTHMLQLAGIAMKGGRQELGRAMYDRAIAGMGAKQRWSRAARWHYGWDLHRNGDTAGALMQWSELLQSSPVRGQWIPTTLAMALWKLDRKEEAKRWYAAAVRTDPGRWSSPADPAALLPDWSEADRALLLEVQRAWAANPPVWP